MTREEKIQGILAITAETLKEADDMSVSLLYVQLAAQLKSHQKSMANWDEIEKIIDEL